MRFEFATAGRIVFGPGTVTQAGGIVRGLGDRALVVTGRDAERTRSLVGRLAAESVECAAFPVASEPSVDLVRDGVRAAAAHRANVIVGFGGGSAIDTAKAIAALMTNPGEIEDHLEVVGRALPLVEAPAPWVAIPTTAGTGAEVTRNAVLASPQHHVKVSLRSPLMLARVAIVDPELTLDLPPAVTASTGLDALTQLVEPFVSARANPLSDAVSREGLGHAAATLRRAFDRGDDAAAREGMSLAALLGGLALANGGLGAAHGIAGPFGGMFDAPHGAVCGILLPHVIDVNLRALGEREPESPARRRYDEVGRILTGDPGADAAAGAAWVADLVRHLDVPRLGAYGATRRDVPSIVEKSAVASSMQANPIRLTAEEIGEIVERAL